MSLFSKNFKSSILLSTIYERIYFKKSSASFMFPLISINATSGSIIQNSDKCLEVFEFSARKVGPKVYTLPIDIA